MPGDLVTASGSRVACDQPQLDGTLQGTAQAGMDLAPSSCSQSLPTTTFHGRIEVADDGWGKLVEPDLTDAGGNVGLSQEAIFVERVWRLLLLDETKPALEPFGHRHRTRRCMLP